MKVIDRMHLQIKSLPHFANGSPIKERLFLVNPELNLREIDVKDRSKKIGEDHFLINTFYYYCKSHVTMGGNVYYKPNFEILILNHQKREVSLKNNGWEANNLETFGTCQYGYPEKLGVKFKLKDVFSDETDWLSINFVIGPYEETIKDKIEYVLDKLKEHSQYQSLENFKLNQTVAQLTKELKFLKKRLIVAKNG